MLRPLSRAYPSTLGTPVIENVDPRIFRLTYFGACMDCHFCHDACCQYGADVDVIRIKAMEKYQAELEQYLGIPRKDWFREDPEDFGFYEDAEYPGKLYTRTQVVPLPEGRSNHNEEACIFLDPAGRGCRLHRFGLERGIPVQEIKPLVCMLFPVAFNQGVLVPAYEFELEDELVCQGPGPSVYQSARTDIAYYFGPELVAELDLIEREEMQKDSPGSIPLKVYSS